MPFHLELTVAETSRCTVDGMIERALPTVMRKVIAGRGTAAGDFRNSRNFRY